MTEDAKRRLSSLVSAAAVAMSLVFVGVEIRQNTAAVRGATMQSISDASSSFMTEVGLDADLAPVIVRVFSGAQSDAFTAAENQQLNMILVAFVRMLENTYLQHREGLVPPAVFESYGWNDGVTTTAYFAEFWASNADQIVSPEFADFLEARLQVQR